MSVPSKLRRAAPLLPALALALCACGDGLPDRPSGPRLVVLYSTCTLSKDFLSPYRSSVDYTPNLQRFADGGVVFERHNTEAGQSGVAFASIYTGTQADRHGIYHHPRTLEPSVYVATEAFRDNGYRPFFWSGQSMASAEGGYGQGVAEGDAFTTFLKFTKRAKKVPPGFFPATTGSGPELDRALEWLAADPDNGAFLQLNFTITHELYHEYATPEKIEAFRRAFPEHATDLTPAEIREGLALYEEHRHRLQFDHPELVSDLGLTPEDTRRLDTVLRLAYATAVNQLDHWFGVFLDRLRGAGVLEDSLIAFTADHGETFLVDSEPIHWTHGLQLAPTVIEVPWIVSAPSLGLEPGRYEEVTRSIDVLPTLLGLAEGRTPPGIAFDGVDLTGALFGERTAPRLEAYSHTSTLGEVRVERYHREGHDVVNAMLPEASPEHMWVRVRDRDRVWELRQLDHTEGMFPAAFDLAKDRERRVNLFDPDDERDAEMLEKLRAYRARLTRAFSAEGGLAPAEELEKLKGLGYVGGE